jgi:hypothetical protein
MSIDHLIFVICMLLIPGGEACQLRSVSNKGVCCHCPCNIRNVRVHTTRPNDVQCVVSTIARKRPVV